MRNVSPLVVLLVLYLLAKNQTAAPPRPPLEV